MYSISNEFLMIAVDQQGAELKSLIDKVVGFEWIWQADPKVWGKSSPVLFPVVGALRENKFIIGDDIFQLPRHGFARDNKFELLEQSEKKLIFGLRANAETKLCFPFDFSLSIVYELLHKSLHVTYIVTNLGSQDMYFSLGAHPAFNLPCERGGEEAYLEFSDDEQLDRYYLNNNLLSKSFDRVPLDLNRLFLKKDTFNEDAWIFKKLNSSKLLLKSDDSNNSLAFQFENFPFFGIWAIPGANFVCLEPWQGLPDHIDHNFKISNKEGIVKLTADDSWSAKWTVTLQSD